MSVIQTQRAGGIITKQLNVITMAIASDRRKIQLYPMQTENHSKSTVITLVRRHSIFRTSPWWESVIGALTVVALSHQAPAYCLEFPRTLVGHELR